MKRTRKQTSPAHPCVVCNEDTHEWCAECREAYCEDHLMMGGLCPDCSADWEDEGDW